MKKESILFHVVLLVNLLPVLVGAFFPTLDGAAHLYNSRLINALIFDSSEMVQNYFSFNPELVPNWTGHFILSIFNFLFPAFIAEKILLLFYLIGLPLIYRSLIKVIQPQNLFLSYFIFPFSYSFVFYLGFYNFSIGLFFLFLSLKYVLNNNHSELELKNVLILLVLTGLTFFSHVFIFGILLMVMLLLFLLSFFNKIKSSVSSMEVVLHIFLKRAGLLLLAVLPSLILFALYFLRRPPLEGAVFLSKLELLGWITNIRPIIALDFSKEQIYSIALYYTLLTLLIISLYRLFNYIFNTNNKPKNFDLMPMIWGCSSIIILFLYFVLPDSNVSAGYVSVRLGLMFFLFIVLWLSSLNFPQWLKSTVILVVIVCDLGFVVYYTHVSRDLNKIAMECYRASEKIESNSIVLPVNYTDNWLLSHFSNYLGVDKPMVILENYESGTGYFPLIWNHASMPNTKLDTQDFTESFCSNWVGNIENKIELIDYLFILGDSDTKDHICYNLIDDAIINKYYLVYESLNCRLYKRKT